MTQACDQVTPSRMWASPASNVHAGSQPSLTALVASPKVPVSPAMNEIPLQQSVTWTAAGLLSTNALLLITNLHSAHPQSRLQQRKPPKQRPGHRAASASATAASTPISRSSAPRRLMYSCCCSATALHAHAACFCSVSYSCASSCSAETASDACGASHTRAL